MCLVRVCLSMFIKILIGSAGCLVISKCSLKLSHVLLWDTWGADYRRQLFLGNVTKKQQNVSYSAPSRFRPGETDRAITGLFQGKSDSFHCQDRACLQKRIHKQLVNVHHVSHVGGRPVSSVPWQSWRFDENVRL